MGAFYHVKGDQTLTTALTTALTVGSNASTAQRNFIIMFELSTALTPSDSQFTFTGQRCSALGTSTAKTPGLMDPADRAAQAACGSNHTAEPTYTANAVFYDTQFNNARTTFVWNLHPGQRLTHAATVGAGLGLQALHASRTEDFVVGAWWDE